MWQTFSISFCLVMVVGVLLLIVDPTCSDYGAKLQRVSADLEWITRSLEEYKQGSGNYPNESEGLRAFVVCPASHPDPARWRQLLRDLPPDPWMTEYSYRLVPGSPRGFEIRSAGKDRKFGTKDDISSLDPE